MRTAILGIIALVTTLSSATAQAECYGDAVQAFGCQNTAAPASRGGDLVRFGDEPAPVVPNYYDQGSGYSSDDLVSAEERRSMMREIIIRGGRSAQSVGSLNQAISASQRPLRPFGTRRIQAFSR
jgi:hypothetical protein